MIWVQLEDRTVWPVDAEDEHGNTVQHELRSGTPTRQQLLAAASVMLAYESLLRRSNKRRNEIANGIRAATNPNAAKEPGR